MSNPSPKGNILQTLMLFVVFFLGFQLLTQSRTNDTRPADEILKNLRSLNAKILDLSIVREKSAYEGKLNEAEKTKKLTSTDAEKARLEAEVLVADAQYKAGIQRNDFGRLNNAFMTLQGTARRLGANPLWTKTEFSLPGHQDFPDRATTGQELYDKIVAELTARSKRDLVWGLVPGYAFIDGLVAISGRVPAFSYAFAALLLAFLVRLAVFPLTQKQYYFGKRMQQLNPLMQEIKAQYSDKNGKVTDPVGLQTRMMQLYKEYGFNPLQGCWPMFIQIPLFLMIYQCMLHYRFEFQKGTFLWINPSTAQATSGWIAPNLGERDYILITIYAISMVVTTFLSPVSDPANAKQQRWIGVAMALFFSVTMFFYPLPSAFVLYWTFTNIFATAQMLWVYKHMQMPELEKVNAPGGGVYPKGSTRTNGTFKATGTPVKHKPKKKR